MPPLHALVSTAALGLILVAVAGEVVWLAVRDGVDRLRGVPTALGLGAWSLVVAPAFLAADRALWPLLGALAPVRLGGVAAVAVGFVGWDGAGFAHHWLGHRTRLGWWTHRSHHTGPAYDLTLALRQSWLPLPALVTFPLVALTGVPFEVALGVAAVSNVWQALVHTSLPVRLPAWLGAVVVTPATHRLHHEASRAVNLGPVLTIWDRVAGTYRAAGQDRSAPSRETVRPASSTCQRSKSP